MGKYRFNQENLSLICSDRELNTEEIHVSNDFYGQADVLKRYANIKGSFKFVFEHGLPFHSVPWAVDLNSGFKLALVASSLRKKVYIHNYNYILDVGPGYLYGIKLYEKLQKKITDERNGSVFFPIHSTHHVDAIYDRISLIDELNGFPEHLKPITVCIYWKDFIKGNHQIFIDNGFEVVSAGHIYDKDFFLRFHDICKNFRYAISNEIGSHVFYSIFSGCKLILIKDESIAYEMGNAKHVDSADIQSIRNDFLRVFSDKNPLGLDEEQKQLLSRFYSEKTKSSFYIFLVIKISNIYYTINKIFTKKYDKKQ